MEFRITGPRLKVMVALLEDVRSEHWGYDLMQRTGLTSGTLYPILDTLSELGWISGHSEKVDPTEVGRPRRRYYLVTGHGTRAMLRQLELVAPWRSAAPAWADL